jgi:hypothetical protein
MSIHEDLELLDQTETDLGDIADAVEESTGIDRRDFMFYSLVTAAATTFGFGSRVLAQTPTPAGQAPQTPPPPPLGNGEPVSWTFQPFPPAKRHRLRRHPRSETASLCHGHSSRIPVERAP